jgi:hypothetical protein
MSKVQLYPGKYTYNQCIQIFDALSAPIKTKTFVFDLDETLGSFGDFYALWLKLDAAMRTKYEVFRSLFELYPEFLRYGICDVLSFIAKKHRLGYCTPIYIYTNNQCVYPNWVSLILRFFDDRLGFSDGQSLFEKPICAFQIGGKRIELGRTSHEKSYADFIRCSMLPKSAEVCFVDDVGYKKMRHDKVYFIQVAPYCHTLSGDEIAERFVTSDIYRELYPERKMWVPKWKTHEPRQEDIVVFHKLMYYVREFFFVSLKREATKKRRSRLGKFTRKIIFAKK